MSDLLDSWQYSEMDYLDLCAKCNRLHSNVRMFLFAHPPPPPLDDNARYSSSSSSSQCSNTFPKYFARRLQLNLPEECWTAMKALEESVPDPFTILVPWDVLLLPSALAYSVSQLWQHSHQSGSPKINLAHFDDLQLSHKSNLNRQEVHIVLHLRCMAWSQRLYRQWIDMLHHIHAIALDGIRQQSPTWTTAIALQRCLTEATYNLKTYHRFVDFSFPQEQQPGGDTSQAVSFLKAMLVTIESLMETERSQFADHCTEFAFSQYTLLDDLHRAKYPIDHSSSASSSAVSADSHQGIDIGGKDYRFYASNVDHISPPSSRMGKLETAYGDEQTVDHLHRADHAHSSASENEEYDDIDDQSSSPYPSYIPPTSTHKKPHPWIHRPPFEAKVVPRGGKTEETESCGEPIWCSHMQELRHRVALWQLQDESNHALKSPYTSPTSAESAFSALNDPRTCANVRLLVFEPLSALQGIGSMLEQVAGAMKYAACLGRVLVLADTDDTQDGTLRKWRLPGCSGAMLDCYFHPLSSSHPSSASSMSSVHSLGHHQCRPTAEELATATLSMDGWGFADFPLRDERMLILSGMPQFGPCAMCDAKGWPSDSDFFDSLLNTAGYRVPESRAEGLYYISAFLAPLRHLSTAVFLKTLLRPRAWLSLTLRQIVSYTLVSPLQPPSTPTTYATQKTTPLLDPTVLPAHFLSLHVRYGMKVAEETLHPLTKYMSMVQHKYPLHRDIFVSTETQDVVAQLIREYPQYRFHHLHYARQEILFLRFSIDDPHDTLFVYDAESRTFCCIPSNESSNPSDTIRYPPSNQSEEQDDAADMQLPLCTLPVQQQISSQQGLHPGSRLWTRSALHEEIVREWFMSLANLFVASEAEGFVGTLTSNWCTMIAKMARTRGDGGAEYFSVDRGSFYTSCF